MLLASANIETSDFLRDRQLQQLKLDLHEQLINGMDFSVLLDDGRSARTIQSHLSAAKGFTRWLVSSGKLPRDPLASVKKPNPATDRRRQRRMLLNEEWPHLEVCDVAQTSRGAKDHRLGGENLEERMCQYERRLRQRR
jgi:site-specific recombinase XerC